IAVLITLFAFVLFLLYRLLQQPHTAFDQSSFGLAFHVAETLLLTLLTVVLWGPWRLTLGALRFLELTAFGSVAAFFAWMQLQLFGQSRRLVLASSEENRPFIFGLASSSNTFRWFVLIVLYGTFIPNTWRRCAAIVGTLSLTPLLLMFLFCKDCAAMGPYWADSLPP